jgi:hypothetical protein
VRRLVALVPLAALATACGSQQSGPVSNSYVSEPELRPPVVTVGTPARDTAPGYVFFAPKKDLPQSGPLIVDNWGEPIWFDPAAAGATDFRVQQYRGKPVLTWWEGHSELGYGFGHYVIADTSYRRIKVVRAGNGFSGDLHGFRITPQGTALIPIYQRKGPLLDSLLQEVDIASGKVLFQWRASDHVPVSESYVPRQPGRLFDYFHINSVEREPGGDFLVSARNTSTVYEISRSTGNVLWRLGGKKSDFTMGPGTVFHWQHDARRLPDGTITIFDNGAAPPLEKQSRALVLRLDLSGNRATLVREYIHPLGLLAPHQGNVQKLPDGHVFVGFGGLPYFTEFAEDGKVVFDAHFPASGDSYRAYRFPWVGRPAGRPSVAYAGGKVYASWNGATEVAAWRLLAGDDPARLKRLGTASRTGFETVLEPPRAERYVAAQALSAGGEILGTSAAVSAASFDFGPRQFAALRG